MPRHVSLTAPVTVYRFPGGLPSADYLLVGDGLTIEYEGPVSIAGVEGHLIAGTRTSDNPPWITHPRMLADVELNLYGSTPFAVLLVPIGDWTFALTWGSGRYLLDDTLIDPEFGLFFGIRRLDPMKLGLLSSSSLDSAARNTQTSFPNGSSLAGYSLNLIGELVSRVSGPADLTGLTYHEEKGKPYRIRAGNSLSVPLAKAPEALLSDLRAICAIVGESDESSPLRFIAQIRPLGDGHPMLRELESRFIAAIGGDDQDGLLGLAWPPELVNQIEEANSFFGANIGERGSVVLEPGFELGELTAEFSVLPPMLRGLRLSDARLVPCLDERGEEGLARPTPLRKWLVYETMIDHRTYCLHQGRWYEIGQEAVTRIREQVTELLANKSDLSFPLWTPTRGQDDEHRYCEQVADQPGYLCLDRNFARTSMHKRFELADVVGPRNEQVHVKWLGEATAASHLFVQAEISAWAQREEPEALRQLHEKVHALDGSRSVVERPRTVVLAAAGRPWEVGRLFTLSQIGLLRLNLSMHNMGVRLQFADIPFVAKTRVSRKRKGEAGGRAA